MQQPKFWERKSKILFILLFPFSVLYFILSKLDYFIKLITAYTPKKPVVCIGNLTVGGTGKTPTLLAITDYLEKQKVKFVIVSKGYKSKLASKEPIVVNPKKHNAKDVGDEPFMIASRTGQKVIICKSRKAAIKKAENLRPDVILMDDGFQNPSIKKTLSILVFDGALGIGNGFTLPFGPLRQSFKSGIKRANAAIIVGKDKTKLSKKINSILTSSATIIPSLTSAQLTKLKKQKLFAFAGIGKPEKFYKTLKDLKLKISKTQAFADHYSYTRKDIEKLIVKANKENLQLITTEKDFVKIPKEYQKNIKYLPISIDVKEFKILEKMLNSVILAKKNKKGKERK